MTKPLLVVSIDGVAPRFISPSVMPTLTQVAREGASCFQATTVIPSVTLPAHASMLRGVAPAGHGVMDNQPIDLGGTAPSFLKRLRQHGLRTAAILNWEPMGCLLEADATDERYHLCGGYDPSEDFAIAGVFADVASRGPDVVFAYLAAPDLAGHDAGWGSSAYLDALASSDAALGAILDQWPCDGSVIVTTDHGGTGHDHSQGGPLDVETFVVVRGAEVAALCRWESASILDIAPTAVAMVGVDPDPHWEGRSLVGHETPIVDHLLTLLTDMAAHTYGEDVTMLEHSLQTAEYLHGNGATDDLALAGVLHDVGHLLGDAGAWGLPDHAAVGARYLRPWLPETVTEPIRLHVDAKRFLVATDEAYADRLSEASTITLRQQGGPFSPDEVVGFQAAVHADDAVALRRADDGGKDADRRRLADDLAAAETWRPALCEALGRGVPDARSLLVGCHCAECRDPVSGQRLRDASDLRGWTVAGRRAGRWLLRHVDGREHVVVPGPTTEPAPPRSRWSGRNELGLALHDAQSRLDDLAADVSRYGLALAEGLSPEAGEVLEFAGRLGFVRETNYGSLFDVRTEVDAENLAYTSLGLPLHTDNPYRDPSPSVQILHCLQSATTGGLSRFRDGFAAAERLRQEDRRHFATLARTPVDFEFRSSDALLQAQRPLVQLNQAEEVTSVAVNHRSMVGPITNDTAGWYDAYLHFVDILEDPVAGVEILLEAGQLVVFDNRRVLHARTGFVAEEGRHLQGCYIDIDAIESLAALGRA